MTIPLVDIKTPIAPLRDTILTRIDEVVQSGAYVLGPQVRAFERELAAYLGVRHVIGVANGTEAITIALKALGVRAGDEVVVPAFTFYATVEAVVNAGARPVFCDVDRATRNVTVDTVRAALTPRTTAIVAVDLFGCPAPIPELRTLGPPVLEDAAQAAGASLRGQRAGALGDVATFSFYPSKNLGCFGDGGAIATNDEGIDDFARALRFHGSRDKRTFEHVGYNSRLDELQAAILRVLLPELDSWCGGRRAVARAYSDAGLERHVTLPAVPDGAEPAWHMFVVLHPDPNELRGELASREIETRCYYRPALHRQPAMAPYWSGEVPLPAADELAQTNLALPMSPNLGVAQVNEVVMAIAAASR